MTSKHEFDAYCDTLEIAEPDYHEQMTVMHEFEVAHETTLKEHGAIDALTRLRCRLSFFMNEYEKLYLEDASVSNYSAKLAHQTAIDTLDLELESHQRWLLQAKGGVL